MRIGYFIPGWPPGAHPNGIVSALGRLGEQLILNGHKVFYVTGDGRTFSSDQEISVGQQAWDGTSTSLLEKLHFKLNSEGAFFRWGSNRLADVVEKLVQVSNLEIFQMEETFGFGLTVLRRLQIPVIIQVNGPWFLHASLQAPQSSKRERLRRIKREGQAIHNAAGITAPSQDVLERIETFYGRPKCPTEVIPYAITPSVRWTLDSCDHNLILFVGRFDRHKGADILIRAFAKVAENRKAIKLLFVGPDYGLRSDGDVTSFWEYLAEQIPLAARERIEYLGPLPQSKIERLRTQAYVTIICSRYDNFPNTVIESMAAGSPTIATNTGGIPEMILNGRNGLLVTAEDVDELAAAITKMLDDPTLACKLGGQAARDCREWFDATKVAERTVAFYSRAIKSYGVH
ncbi:MAG: glycosyltransferase family 4 protein [Alphaproteobacteria bacterium]|nr:glycosyltransferase family 4 protein [Alphaproteobacteria bacterium]